MKIANNLFSVSETASKVGISPYTLVNWCKFWESDYEKPPEIIFPVIKYVGRNGMRMFDSADVELLKVFKEKMRQFKNNKIAIIKSFNLKEEKKDG